MVLSSLYERCSEKNYEATCGQERVPESISDVFHEHENTECQQMGYFFFFFATLAPRFFNLIAHTASFKKKYWYMVSTPDQLNKILWK